MQPDKLPPRPRQGQGGVSIWQSTARALQQDSRDPRLTGTDPGNGGSVPSAARGWALVPGGKVASLNPLHSGLCVQLMLRVRGRLEGKVPDLRRPPVAEGADQRAREAAPSCRGRRTPGLRPARDHRPVERGLGPPCVTGDHACLGAPSQAVCPRRLRGGGEARLAGCRRPGTVPWRGVCVSGVGQKGIPGSGDSRRQSRWLCHPRRHQGFFPDSCRKLGTALVLVTTGRGAPEGRQRATACPARPLAGGQKQGPMGATLISVPGHTHAQPLRG